MSDLSDGNASDFMYRLPVEQPRYIYRGIAFSYHALNANRVACVGWLLPEGKRMDLG